MPYQINETQCISCGKCARVCPVQCISPVGDTSASGAAALHEAGHSEHPGTHGGEHHHGHHHHRDGGDGGHWKHHHHGHHGGRPDGQHGMPSAETAGVDQHAPDQAESTSGTDESSK